MDDRLNSLPHKAEPGIAEEPVAAAPSVSHDNAAPSDMPSWLKDPVPVASSGWKRTAALWGGSLAALAVVFGGALWLFDQHQSDSAMEVVAMSTVPAAQPAQPAPTRRESALPPLVLLTPAPTPAPEAAKEAARAPMAELPPAAVVPRKTEPVQTQVPKVTAKPVLAKATPKTVLHPERKLALVKPAGVAPKAAAKLLVLAPKRTPVSAKARPKALAAVMLPPARARRAAAEPPRENAPSKCQHGELARECAARNGSY